MSSYKITSWNQIIDQQNIIRPIFTFVPDLDFLNYLQLNSNPIAIRLNGSQWYDGIHFVSCYSSKDFPSYGPNYFDVTDHYVMVLNDIEFSLFPDPKQQVAFFQIDMGVRSQDLTCIDLEDAQKIKEPFNIPYQLGDSTQDKSIWQTVITVLLIIVGVFIIGFVIMILFYHH